jgi:hypothetical protein
MTTEPGSGTPLAEHEKTEGHEEPAAPVSSEPESTSDPAASVAGPASSDDVHPVRIPTGPLRTLRAPAAQAPGAGVLAILALAWFAATLWVLQREISTSVTDAVAIASAAISLPTVVSAALVAGMASGLAAVNLVDRRGGSATVRWAGALVVSLLVGVLAAVAVVAGYGGEASGILAGTIAAAAVVGGAVAGIRPAPVVGAVVTASLAVFAVVFLLNFFHDPLISLFGGDSSGSVEGARGWLAFLSALACGLASGLVGFAYLRRAVRRGLTVGWPVFMLAGGGVGILLLATEVITRIGGGQILDAVSSLSAADRAFRSSADSSRIRFALLVLFIGALACTIAFGRTLKPRR